MSKRISKLINVSTKTPKFESKYNLIYIKYDIICIKIIEFVEF